MTTQVKEMALSTEKTAEMVALLEEMMFQLELRGYEKHDPLIKRALLMQQQIKAQKKH